MIFLIVYSLVIAVLILYVTGWLRRRDIELVVILAPVAVFAVITLGHLKII